MHARVEAAEVVRHPRHGHGHVRVEQSAVCRHVEDALVCFAREHVESNGVGLCRLEVTEQIAAHANSKDVVGRDSVKVVELQANLAFDAVRHDAAVARSELLADC